MGLESNGRASELPDNRGEPKQEYNIKLDNLQEEVPTRAMQAYLS